MNEKMRKALVFTLILLPVAAVGAYFSALYQLDFLGDELFVEVMAVLGSTGAFVAVYMVQITVYMIIMGFGGYLLADKLGLMKPFRFEKKKLFKTIWLEENRT